VDLFIDHITASGTIFETATGTKEFSFSAEIPFLNFVWVAVTFFAALAVFTLFFKKIWTD